MEVKPGYRQTAVGIAPADWIATTVDQLIADEIIEKPLDGNHGNIHPKSSDFVDSGIPFVMANNVQNGRVDLVGCACIRKEQADFLQKGFSKTGDVLLTHKATIGNTAIVGTIPYPYIMLTPQVTYYRVTDKTRLNNIYLRYYFDTAGFQSLLRALSGGGTRSYIGISAQRQLPIVFPPKLDEQIAIAEHLGDVDALLGGLDRLIAKKRDIKQAAMQQLLTGQTRLPGFSGKWEERLLGGIADILKGKDLSKSSMTTEGVRPCILYGELFTTYGQIISRVLGRTNSSEGVPSMSGDVLMPGSTTTTGADLATASALLVDGVALGGDILIIRRKGLGFDPAFLANYLTFAKRNEISELTQGTTIHHLYGKDLKSLTIQFPPFPEQTAIAAVISDIDAELAFLESRLTKTRAIKQGMMQELLTGRTRLV